MDTHEPTLRVSVHEHEITALQVKYPKLTRTEVMDIVGRKGPMRAEVESELERISGIKR